MDHNQFVAGGGHIVGGTAYLAGKEVGRWNNGQFYIDPGHEEHLAKHLVQPGENEPLKDQVQVAPSTQGDLTATSSAPSLPGEVEPRAVKVAKTKVTPPPVAQPGENGPIGDDPMAALNAALATPAA